MARGVITNGFERGRGAILSMALSYPYRRAAIYQPVTPPVPVDPETESAIDVTTDPWTPWTGGPDGGIVPGVPGTVDHAIVVEPGGTYMGADVVAVANYIFTYAIYYTRADGCGATACNVAGPPWAISAGVTAERPALGQTGHGLITFQQPDMGSVCNIAGGAPSNTYGAALPVQAYAPGGWSAVPGDTTPATDCGAGLKRTWSQLFRQFQIFGSLAQPTTWRPWLSCTAQMAIVIRFL